MDAFQKKFTTPRRFMLAATIKEGHKTGGLSLGLPDNAHTVLAATNKCLAQSNKSRTGAKATKKRKPPTRTGVDRALQPTPVNSARGWVLYIEDKEAR